MKIILATDGSESALAAVDFLARFPLPQDTEVTVVTVIDPTLFGCGDIDRLDEGERAAIAGTEESLRREALQLLDSEAARLRAAGLSGTTEVRFGIPVGEIVKAAEERGADLVVLGSRGTGAIKRFLMGSVSHHVLHYAPCSVLLVRHPSRIPLEAPWHILLAYDDSKPAKRAVELCASLPLSPTDSVTVLTVMPLVTLYRQDIRQRLSPFWRQKKRAAQEALQAAIKAVHWATPQVVAELRESPNICQEILDAAERTDSDLIMLGDKGTGAFEKLLLGSVTNRTARHAACAVWVVRSREDAE